MALKIRKLDPLLLTALVVAWNGFVRWFSANKTTYPHADALSLTTNGTDPAATPDLITTANASSLPTGITLANAVVAYLIRHVGDGTYAHAAADTVNLATLVALTPLASTAIQSALNTRLNLIKATYNLHLAQATVHSTDDTDNAIATADASDLATSETLASALKAKANLHTQFAPGSFQIQRVSA